MSKYVWTAGCLILLWLSFYIGSKIDGGSFGWWSFPYTMTCVILIAFFIKKVLEYKKIITQNLF